MRLKYLLIAILILTAASAAAVDSDREFGRRAVVKLDTSNTAEKGYIFVAYTSGSGTVMRRASLDSVFKAGGMETTAPEGERYIYPYNGATGFAGTPALGMLTTTNTGPRWYDGEAWLPIGVGYDDTALWAKFAEYLLKSEHDADVAATTTRLDNLDTQVAQLKAAMDAHGITVSGIAPATLDALAFGNVVAGQNKTMQTATFQNTGLGDLIMYGASFSGTGQAKFSSSGGCSNLTLAPNATCQEDITFTPGTAGSYTATLSLAHNAAGSPTTVSLSGTGVAASACSTTPYADISTGASPTATQVGASTFNVYNGIRIDAGQASHNVCKVGFYIQNVADAGGVNGLPSIPWRVEVWSTDANGALYEMKGYTASISGLSADSIGTNPVLAFAAPVTVAATDAVVVVREDHGYTSANNISLASNTTTSESYSHAVRYQNTKAVGAEVAGTEKKLQLYEVQ